MRATLHPDARRDRRGRRAHRPAHRRPRLHRGRAVRRAVPRSFLQRRRRRAEHARRRHRPRRGGVRPVRLLDRDVRDACGRTSSCATARCCTISRCGSSASAAGSSTGSTALTHYALEDIAVMRAQPGMTVLAPADFRAGADRADGDHDGRGPDLLQARQERDRHGAGPRRSPPARRRRADRRRPRRRDRHDRIDHARSAAAAVELLEDRGGGRASSSLRRLSPCPDRRRWSPRCETSRSWSPSRRTT